MRGDDSLVHNPPLSLTPALSQGQFTQLSAPINRPALYAGVISAAVREELAPPVVPVPFVLFPLPALSMEERLLRQLENTLGDEIHYCAQTPEQQRYQIYDPERLVKLVLVSRPSSCWQIPRSQRSKDGPESWVRPPATDRQTGDWGRRQKGFDH